MGDVKFSLVNLGEWSKPITKLIETVGDAVGALFEPQKIRKRAKAEGDALIIKTKAHVEAADIMERAGRRIANSERRHQRNIESIVQKSSEALPNSVSEEPVSHDWIARFFEASQDVGDEEVQRLWAKVLAGEVAKPGSFSLHTIATLRIIDRKNAGLFELAANYVVTLDNGDLQFIPYTSATRGHLQSKGISLLDMSSLISLGLFQDGLTQGFEAGYEDRMVYFDRKLTIKNPFTSKKSFMIWHLSEVGNEIYALCEPHFDEDYIEKLRAGLDEDGFDVSDADAG